MARTAYIPYNDDREEQKAEERKARRLARNEEVTYVPGHKNWGHLNPNDPEFESVTIFAEYLIDDERGDFSHAELSALAFRCKAPVPRVQKELESYGLRLRFREHARPFRGVRENPYTLYAGNPMSGGGGGNSIIGMAD